jgi:hypothetical protein
MVNRSGSVWAPCTDVRSRGESFRRLASPRDVIGHQQGVRRLFQVGMGLIGILFHRGVFQRAGHACHVTIGPGRVGVGEAVLAAIRLADAIDNRLAGLGIVLAVGELPAVIGAHGVELVAYGGNPRA